MITQYTRLVVNDVTGEIDHCTSQDFPFADGWEPVNDPKVATTNFDFEIDVDYPDADFGIGVNQQMIRGRKILDNFEIIAGKPVLKANAETEVSSKVLRISAPKSINESDIKVELSAQIANQLFDSGSSDKELLDDIRKLDPNTPLSLIDLKTIQLIRINKQLRS